jgi:acetyl-CoA synthetase
LHGTLKDGNVAWFPDGYLNVCYNAVDRHAFQHPHKIAMIWEGDEPDQVRSISYQELLQKVSQIANALQSQGVKKGDVVTIYMPMIPELPMTMLACARLGAVHSVVFAGFSAEALASRVSAAQSKYLVTSDIGKRGGKTIQLKNIVNEARTKEGAENYLKTIFVWEHAVATRMDQDTPPPS